MRSWNYQKWNSKQTVEFYDGSIKSYLHVGFGVVCVAGSEETDVSALVRLRFYTNISALQLRSPHLEIWIFYGLSLIFLSEENFSRFLMPPAVLTFSPGMGLLEVIHFSCSMPCALDLYYRSRSHPYICTRFIGYHSTAFGPQHSVRFFAICDEKEDIGQLNIIFFKCKVIINWNKRNNQVIR